MKVGVIFPQTEIGSDARLILDFACETESLGYNHLAAFDHVLGAVRSDRHPELPFAYDERSSFHEPLTLFSYLAAVTDRVELATTILVLPQRQTALVAKQAAQVAILSSGRLRLGVGIGWNWVEFEALRMPFDVRARVMEEQVHLLRALWTTNPVSYEGNYHRIDRAGINPLPPPIPIWIGGGTRAAFDRAARLGDGFVFGRPSDHEHIAYVLQRVQENGRDPSEFGVEGRIELGDGDLGRCLGELDRWRDAGATHVSFTTTGAGLTEPRAHVEAIARFADAAL